MNYGRLVLGVAGMGDGQREYAEGAGNGSGLAHRVERNEKVQTCECVQQAGQSVVVYVTDTHDECDGVCGGRLQQAGACVSLLRI